MPATNIDAPPSFQYMFHAAVVPAGVVDVLHRRDAKEQLRTASLKLISSTNSKCVYDLISDSLSLAPAPAPDGMDAFYRLFLVPGMGHCFGGLGPTSFGQGLIPGTNIVNDTAHNILLALVDWVEGGDAAAPETITGSVSLAAGDEVDVVDPPERTFCRYPIESVWNGTAFVC
ncbi:hypothetical protein K438DRAFT_1989019 [Mycena galopus ATCC 62051]|nr:hypothetical protein K438DRAFT_1989019 [Mycena galopus ATCC 62051]